MKLIRSFSFAWCGLKYCVSTQFNFRLHLVLATVVILSGLYLHITHTEWLFVGVAIGTVLVMEMINTAIEKLCDLLYKDFHPGVKIIKDIAAAAVLVTAIMSACIGMLIFMPRIINLLNSFV